MFTHERNNMSISFKKIYLLTALIGFFNFTNNIASETSVKVSFPMFTAAHRWLQKGNTKIAALTFLTVLLVDQYFKNKTRPSDEDISEEGYARRKNEILYGNQSIWNKIKLLISFIDDFYVFGRSEKKEDQEITLTKADGTKVTVKESKTIIKGTGPINFIYKKIFGKVEDTLKNIKNIVLLLGIIDGLLGGDINILLNPMDGKFNIKV